MAKNESTPIDVVETSKERKGKAPLSGVEHARGGYKRGIGIFDLILRISAFASALAATVAMGTTEQTLPFFTQFFQFQASYDDLPTFSFFVIAMAIVTSYLILSIPFSIVCIARPLAIGARLLLIIFDTVIVTLTTSAASSSVAIVYLAHNGNSSANWLAICQQYGDFCQKISGAVLASFITVVLLVFMVQLSQKRRETNIAVKTTAASVFFKFINWNSFVLPNLKKKKNRNALDTTEHGAFAAETPRASVVFVGNGDTDGDTPFLPSLWRHGWCLLKTLSNIFPFFVFEPYKDNRMDLLAPKLVSVALNLVGLGLCIWKLNTLGLLPTLVSDWVSSLPPAQV
ncbi:unnamed protein product [Fraxinus pennsylvanica]|uniref:CASP-like protein n=1 Tax=Fraxinus pennsylvanica TaxID=56036 RepID=A0AAD2DNV5_9LAMI|nr:unnamed protein product [Fraxinus pennsylvanica]